MAITVAGARTRRWTRREYERMIDKGIFRPDDRLELIEGYLVIKEPQTTTHTTGIALVAEALRQVFGAGWFVRLQAPVALDDRSEPEPDVSVVPGSPRDYLGAHPSRPALVVEVAETGLRLDRTVKAAIYARARVEDYWILNLVDRALEVHREPVAITPRGRRWRYRSFQGLGPSDIVTPLAAPAARIPVADLLP